MPFLSYNCLIKLKGTLRHGKKGGKRGIQMEGKMESSKVQKDNSQSFNKLARERKMNKIEPRWRNSSYILEIIQNITQPPKKHMPKHAYIRYHSLPQNPPHLSWKAMPKQSYLDLSSKSHKSCAKAPSLRVLGSGSSWLTHSHEIHLHICICIKMYILI